MPAMLTIAILSLTLLLADPRLVAPVQLLQTTPTGREVLSAAGTLRMGSGPITISVYSAERPPPVAVPVLTGETAAALYNDQRNGIWIHERSLRLSTEHVAVMLAHELVHSAQKGLGMSCLAREYAAYELDAAVRVELGLEQPTWLGPAGTTARAAWVQRVYGDFCARPGLG